MGVVACLGADVCVCMHMWKPELRLGCLSSGAIPLVLLFLFFLTFIYVFVRVCASACVCESMCVCAGSFAHEWT